MGLAYCGQKSMNEKAISDNSWKIGLKKRGLGQVVTYIESINDTFPDPNSPIINDILVPLGEESLCTLARELNCNFGDVKSSNWQKWMLSYLICIARRKLCILKYLRDEALNNNTDIAALCINIVLNEGTLLADLSELDSTVPGPILKYKNKPIIVKKIG